ncbi:MAG: hypothetical protein C5B59_08785 [Bacteroidetes bacterium]|nr:MAG: hypothetical protein C5B59_08785 [Bacteroidota bacterium]
MSKLDTKTLNPPLSVTVVRDQAGVDELVNWLLAHPEVGLDCETTPVKFFQPRKMRLLQFGDRDRQFVVDLLDFVDRDPDALRDAQGFFGINLHKYPKLEAFLKSVRPFLESGLWLKVGVNLWFEYICLYWSFGIRSWNFYDCQLAERVIYAGGHSLKDFEFFDMENMMLRYFNVEIDKTFQTSFDVDNELSEAQYEYAALDVRFPFAIRVKQLKTGEKAGLVRTFRTENEAIGSFADMHAHGEKLDIAKWNANTQDAENKRAEALGKLDGFFLPICGSKNDIVTDAMVEEATAVWKKFNEVTEEELSIKASIKEAKKSKDLPQFTALEMLLTQKVENRKAEKDHYKKIAGDLGKRRTQQKKILEKCQGQALVNYDSNAQVYKILVENFPALKELESTNDEDLKIFASVFESDGKTIKIPGDPLIDALRDYREWDKRVKTYGYLWTTEWVNRPCSDEGWLSPYTHRLHSMYNQLMAETGRTSSDNPNGQNLPRGAEVRSCFIADEGYVYITIDMSGAELRILAEEAKAKIWIDAFNADEDVHSICTEIIFPEEWMAEAEEGCAYYKIDPKTGKAAHKKCKCKKHKARREVTKTLNFGIAYGMEAATLAARAGIPQEEAEHVFEVWKIKFAEIWNYLQESGFKTKQDGASYTMYGRRRLFPPPTQERARKKCIEDYPEKLEFSEIQQEQNIAEFIAQNGRKPNKEERFWLTHREPNQKQLTRAFIAISRGIERAGKNHRIQGTNADIIKIAMGSGKSPKGRPYLFHTLRLLKAKLVKMVHDELVIMAPKENADRVAKLVGIAFRTAAAERMTKVTMENEHKVSHCWEK